MQLSEKGAAFIALHEGFRANWYLDPIGVKTIGIGFTFRSKAFRKWWKANKGLPEGHGSISAAEAQDALRYLVNEEYGAAVNRFLGHEVPQHVFDAMASAVYNLGPGALQWKWAAAAKKGNYGMAAALLRKTGTTAAGKRLPGLVRRRKEEADLLERGIYTGVFGRTSTQKPKPAPTHPTDPKRSPVAPATGIAAIMTAIGVAFYQFACDLPLVWRLFEACQ